MHVHCLRCVCFLPLVLALGCGPGGQPMSIDASEVKNYVDGNQDEVARQERVNRASEGGGEEDE